MSTLGERVATLEAEMSQKEKNDETLFALHNNEIVPALAKINVQLSVISEQNSNTTRIQEGLITKLEKVEGEQIRCKATREQQSKSDNKALTVATKAGAWAGVGMFIIGVIAGAYKLFLMLVKNAVHP